MVRADGSLPTVWNPLPTSAPSITTPRAWATSSEGEKEYGGFLLAYNYMLTDHRQLLDLLDPLA